jgi:hypothetical protein
VVRGEREERAPAGMRRPRAGFGIIEEIFHDHVDFAAY